MTQFTSEQVADFWQKYKHDGDHDARQNLILAYSNLVNRVATRISMRMPTAVEHADLVSYGIFGLIDAIERFEPERDIKFESYAATRIHGAIIDELRAVDWVPRSVRARAREVDRVYGELEAKFHRTPTYNEVAQAMEVTTDQLRTILTQISSVNVVALDEFIAPHGSSGGEGTRLVDTISDPQVLGPAETILSTEASELLQEAIAELPERERLVVTLYYFDRLNLAAIGKVLGVSESRVSQLHSSAVGKLRSGMHRQGFH